MLAEKLGASQVCDGDEVPGRDEDVARLQIAVDIAGSVEDGYAGEDLVEIVEGSRKGERVGRNQGAEVVFAKWEVKKETTRLGAGKNGLKWHDVRRAPVDSFVGSDFRVGKASLVLGVPRNELTREDFPCDGRANLPNNPGEALAHRRDGQGRPQPHGR
jgi:hypothetical protein